MKFLLMLCLVLGAVAIHSVLGDENQQEISLKSSVPKKQDSEEKSKVDDETKDQLQESDNDDGQFDKQKQEASEGSGDDEGDEDDDDSSVVENVDDNKSNQHPEESSTENEAENEAESEEESVRRNEEAKIETSNKKKGRKVLAVPMYYPGGYLGARHYQGGPAQFNPAGFWQYPYPYVHPMYPQCQCNCNGKDDEEEDEDEQKGKGKKTRRKQLVPSHYYGPPSAGWGGFHPGHTGAGWGAPYWYKSRIPTPMGQQPSRRFGIETGFQGPYAQHFSDYGMGHPGYSYLGGNAGFLETGDHGYGGGDGYGWNHGYGGYGDLENSGANPGWNHAIGHPYIPHGHHHKGHHTLSDHHGLNHIDINHGHAYFSHELAYQHLPTAQGHIQIASSGHNIGMGGHNLGGMADKEDPGHGTSGDFVGGIHADMGVHGHHDGGHHGGHGYHAPHNVLDDAIADMQVEHGNFHTAGHGFGNAGLHGYVGDHFGSFSGHHGGGQHGGALHTGMPDHFGPLIENSDDSEDDHGGFTHGFANGGAHGFNERIFGDFGAHAGHGGAFDGHLGNSGTGSLIGGLHKSGVPKQKKPVAKKPSGKAKTRSLKNKRQ